MVVILGLLPQGWQLIGLLIVNMYFVMPKKASQASVQSLLLAFLATTLYQYKTRPQDWFEVCGQICEDIGDRLRLRLTKAIKGQNS